jgi:hypothetical protein
VAGEGGQEVDVVAGMPEHDPPAGLDVAEWGNAMSRVAIRAQMCR